MNSRSTVRREIDPSGFVLALATDADRERIYRLRHDVYARELAQHEICEEERLRDALDGRNLYLVAKSRDEIAGFVSITPPGPAYSVDKYVSRDVLPFPFDRGLFEVRLLTVVHARRGTIIAALLMYGALRAVERDGGTRIVAIGRREVVPMYRRCGLDPVGLTVRSGAVTYDVLQASTEQIRERMRVFDPLLGRLEENTDWRLDVPFRRPAGCFHGGAFFEAIGPRFDTLDRAAGVINADVLDAWFPPSPKVLESLRAHLPWLVRTSPPTACEGFLETAATERGVELRNLVPGAGSSDLIFRAFPRWLGRRSRALILEPTYGEYAHVLEKVVGCAVDRLPLSRAQGYDLDLGRLDEAIRRGYDLVVLVNPNSPTGRYVPASELAAVLNRAPEATRIWVDETYVDYAGESLERPAAASKNVFVCKSLSKAYALSGVRVAYLCGPAVPLEDLRSQTPPWVVGLPAQVAAVRALEDRAYYAARWSETAVLRGLLAADLSALGLDVVAGVANFLLCHLPEEGPDASTVVARCRRRALYLRDASAMGRTLGRHAIRIAVKDAATNRRIREVLADAMEASDEIM